MDLDLGAVRAFVAVADDRYFGEAAVRLGVSQQAISKRIAKLESDLGTTLFRRSHGGAELTEDGASFLTHARALIGLADQAVELLRTRHRRLRVDVLASRIAPMDLVREFHEASPDVTIDIVTSAGLTDRVAELSSGTVDAVFCRAVGLPGSEEGLAEDIECTPAYLDSMHILVGRRHPLATRRSVPMSDLAGLTAWMNNNERESEWADFYRIFSSTFGVGIDPSGPNFGLDHSVERIAASDDLVTFVGERVRVPWNPDVVQIPIVEPVPLFPFSLLWHKHNRHPALRRLVAHIQSNHRPLDPSREWLPEADRAAFL
ncbi:LysR family transcriptional regulator [Actinomadura sp. 9N407]|uniref:LysR family transcriptional regulator n=1 Tax=Actinomadura sp. 9N407 TaxID=3375154 RepID=UPI0037BC2457